MQSFKIIRAYDPAIDLEASGAMSNTPQWGEFMATRDPELLRFLDGEKPVVYSCRAMNRREIRELRTKASIGDQAEYAFTRCVVSISDMMWPDGSRRQWSRRDDKPISDEELELVFAEADIQEVGHIIVAQSFLAPGSRRYVQPRAISLDALTAAGLAWHRRRAAQTSPPDAGPSGASKPSPEAPPPGLPTS